jgi:hypothetical protein
MIQLKVRAPCKQCGAILTNYIDKHSLRILDNPQPYPTGPRIARWKATDTKPCPCGMFAPNTWTLPWPLNIEGLCRLVPEKESIICHITPGNESTSQPT